MALIRLKRCDAHRPSGNSLGRRNPYKIRPLWLIFREVGKLLSSKKPLFHPEYNDRLWSVSLLRIPTRVLFGRLNCFSWLSIEIHSKLPWMRIYTKVAAVKRMKFAISFHNQFKKSSPLEWNYNPSPPPPHWISPPKIQRWIVNNIIKLYHFTVRVFSSSSVPLAAYHSEKLFHE